MKGLEMPPHHQARGRQAPCMLLPVPWGTAECPGSPDRAWSFKGWLCHVQSLMPQPASALPSFGSPLCPSHTRIHLSGERGSTR